MLSRSSLLAAAAVAVSGVSLSSLASACDRGCTCACAAPAQVVSSTAPVAAPARVVSTPVVRQYRSAYQGSMPAGHAQYDYARRHFRGL